MSTLCLDCMINFEGNGHECIKRIEQRERKQRDMKKLILNHMKIGAYVHIDDVVKIIELLT